MEGEPRRQESTLSPFAGITDPGISESVLGMHDLIHTKVISMNSVSCRRMPVLNKKAT